MFLLLGVLEGVGGGVKRRREGGRGEGRGGYGLQSREVPRNSRLALLGAGALKGACVSFPEGSTLPLLARGGLWTAFVQCSAVTDPGASPAGVFGRLPTSLAPSCAQNQPLSSATFAQVKSISAIVGSGAFAVDLPWNTRVLLRPFRVKLLEWWKHS